MKAIRLMACGAFAVTLTAQMRYPGQTNPYPPGQIPGQTGPYPGGRNPNDPYPGGVGGVGRGRGSSIPGRSSQDKAITISTLGNLRLANANHLILEAADHRIITYKITGKTTIERDGKPVQITSFHPGDRVTVDAIGDENGFFTALGVVFNQPGSAADQAAAARTWDLPRGEAVANAGAMNQDSDDARPVIRRAGDKPAAAAPASTGTNAEPAGEPPEERRPATIVGTADAPPDADDPGRPQLRRGQPRVRSAAAASEPVAVTPPRVEARQTDPPRTDVAAAEPADTAALIPVEEDPIIVQARESAFAYSDTLPNFLARQVITRYDTDNPKQGWNARDTVTSDITNEDHIETYTNIKVGSRGVKSMEETGGSWSTGQFAAIQDDLFQPETAATFRKSGQDTIQGRRADVFTFDVKRENSRWRIIAAAQLYYPAYRGKVWIDKMSSRVLRIEMESRGVPPLFPFAKLETTVDYDFVRLGATSAFLLPTVGEVLMCEQGSPRCQRNRIEYRNYRKFGAESGISFEDDK